MTVALRFNWFASPLLVDAITTQQMQKRLHTQIGLRCWTTKKRKSQKGEMWSLHTDIKKHSLSLTHIHSHIYSIQCQVGQHWFDGILSLDPVRGPGCPPHCQLCVAVYSRPAQRHNSPSAIPQASFTPGQESWYNEFTKQESNHYQLSPIKHAYHSRFYL